jgi:hypothetical protein
VFRYVFVWNVGNSSRQTVQSTGGERADREKAVWGLLIGAAA